MNIHAEFDYAIKYESTDLSFLYQDLLEPKEEETSGK